MRCFTTTRQAVSLLSHLWISVKRSRVQTVHSRFNGTLTAFCDSTRRNGEEGVDEWASFTRTSANIRRASNPRAGLKPESRRWSIKSFPAPSIQEEKPFRLLCPQPHLRPPL